MTDIVKSIEGFEARVGKTESGKFFVYVRIYKRNGSTGVMFVKNYHSDISSALQFAGTINLDGISKGYMAVNSDEVFL